MIIKRSLDVFLSLLGLILVSPVLLGTALLIYLHDRHSPFYISYRIGRKGVPFRLYKLRTMKVNADKSGLDSTSDSDPRILPMGKWIRKCKLDEFPQLLNVIRGEMSLVGPRPNVPRQVATYTESEKDLLLYHPGVTDLASIVFSNEGEILDKSPSPELEYELRIRPLKSKLGLYYQRRRSLRSDLLLCVLTLLNLIHRPFTMKSLRRLFPELKEISI